MKKPKVIVICGPTASGKTDLSIELAKRINGEIVSADSMQIYKYMNIGSAKPTLDEMQGIQHYMMDCIEPDIRFSVAEYKKEAEKYINIILKKNKIPIVVGGTGLYIDSIIYGIEYNEIKLDENYRKKLENRVEIEGLEILYNEAKKIDPKAMEKISANDKKRILRVLEIYNDTGKTKTQLELESRKNGPRYNYKVFALNMDRKILYERINKRVDLMFEKGLLQEVKELKERFDKLPTAIQGLGYKETIEFLDRKISYNEMIEKIKMETRRYAKRQLTWFRKNKEIIWLDGLDTTEKNIQTILEEMN
jgi:tRNA dimethylallyltransferase